jgi:hypothetical protein
VHQVVAMAVERRQRALHSIEDEDAYPSR